MQKNKLGKGIKLLIAVLLFWNVFLTYKVYTKPSDNVVVDSDTTVVNKNATYTTTDLTKAAEKSVNKAVGIDLLRVKVVDLFIAQKN